MDIDGPNPNEEAAFDRAMMEIYTRALSEANYRATIFHDMLIRRRGLATAKALINAMRVSEGYTALYLKGRLDLTVEAVILDNARWHPLFTSDEMSRIRARLREYQYPAAVASE